MRSISRPIAQISSLTTLHCRTTLLGIISDNEAWAIMGKYTFDLGGGGFKDEGPGAKLTIYGGYENMTVL